MGMNVQQVNSQKQITLATLSGSGSGTGVVVPAATVGISVNETSGTADIAIEVSNDDTTYFKYKSPVDLTSITASASYAISCPFKYIRATNNSTGDATIYLTW